MPFENTFCDREGCGHNVPDHPNDEHCLKCDCVGFFAKDISRDPLGENAIASISKDIQKLLKKND